MTVETTNKLSGEVHSQADSHESKQAKFDRSIRGMINGFSIKNSPYAERISDYEVRFAMALDLTKSRGRRYANSEFSNFAVTNDNAEAAISKLQDFLKTLLERLNACDGNLVLLGPPGTGKDHLLMAMMRDAITKYGIKVRWLDGVRLFSEIKSGITRGDVEDRLSALTKVQILAISDPVPPRDELTSYELAILRDVIEQRYSRGLATWVTTNVQTPEDAKKLFTAPVLGRLLDGATEVFCNWGNYRKPNP